MRASSVVAIAVGPRKLEPLFGGSGVTPLVDGAPDLETGSVWRCSEGPDGVLSAETELAPPGGARADLWSLAQRFKTDPAYPDAVLDESDVLVANPGLDDPGLRDLLGLAFITIDNEDSRDLDQAMHLAPEGDGYVVYYALADAAYYVAPGSALFEEALQRGASYYFPGFAIPMLPPALSEGLISLNPDVERRALVFEMHLDETGLCQRTDVYQAKIKSRAKLSYDGVQAFYDAPKKSRLRQQSYTETLDLLRTVGLLRIADAQRRNVIRYNRIGLAVGFTDERGARFTAFAEIRNDCEKYNEQISLLCNIEGAQLLLEKASAPELQPVFRVHPAPPPERLDELAKAIEAVARAHFLPLARWRWRREKGESLATYLRRLPKSGDFVGVSRAIERLALITNVRSTFESEPGVHYGVGALVYARLSSPMREVVGIFTHKELLEALDGEGSDPKEDSALRERVLKAANESKVRQKRVTNECNRLVLDGIFQPDLKLRYKERPVRTGTIMGVKDDRLYVQLDDPPLEVKLYARDIGQVTDSRPERSADSVALVGHRRGQPLYWRLGDSIGVRVLDYYAPRRRWMLVPSL